MKLTISWRFTAAAGDCIINRNDLRRIEIEHFNFFFSCQRCSLFHLIYDVANQALMLGINLHNVCGQFVMTQVLLIAI